MKSTLRIFLRSYLLLALLVVASLGCDSERLDDGAAEAGEKITLVLNWDDPAPQPTDPFIINSAVFTGDVLMISVSYSGGCKEHSFIMYTSSYITLSFPPRVSAWMVHDGHLDGCVAFVTETIPLDLDILIQDLSGPFNIELIATGTGEAIHVAYSG